MYVVEVLAAHGFKCHSYADDTQMYISVPAADAVDAALDLYFLPVYLRIKYKNRDAGQQVSAGTNSPYLA